MFCAHCGRKNPDAANFCFSCGSKLSREETATTSVELSEGPAALIDHAMPPLAVKAPQVQNKQCPLCGVFNTGIADVCDCGYDFRSGILRSAVTRGAQDAEDGAKVPVLPFFPVATHKFIALSICSFGIYELYWSYQNWKRIQLMTRGHISPFWRAFFAPLWGFSLFRQVRERAVSEQVTVAWSSSVLGALYLALSLSWRLPDPWWLISFATLVPMLPVQQVAQRVNQLRGSSEDRNEHYSSANVILIVLGGLLLVLTIAGTLPK